MKKSAAREKRLTSRGTGCAIIAAVLVVGSVAIGAVYHVQQEAAVRRITGKSLMIPSRHGPLEYAEAGSGPPVLMIHGTGGGDLRTNRVWLHS